MDVNQTPLSIGAGSSSIFFSFEKNVPDTSVRFIKHNIVGSSISTLIVGGSVSNFSNNNINCPITVGANNITYFATGSEIGWVDSNITTITKVGISYSPTRIIYSSPTNKLYTSNGSSATIDVWNDPASSGSVLTKLDTITFPGTDFTVSNIFVDSVSNRLYITTNYNIYIINTTNNSLIGSISLDNNFMALGSLELNAAAFLDIANNRLYIHQGAGSAPYNYSQIHIINTSTITITNSIRTNASYATDIIVDANKNIAYLNHNQSASNNNNANYLDIIDLNASIQNNNTAVGLRQVGLGLPSNSMIAIGNKLILSGSAYPSFLLYNTLIKMINTI